MTSTFFQQLRNTKLIPGRQSLARGVLVVFFFCLGCIHFKLGDSSPLRASNTEYKEPTKPFILFKDSDADKSWQSNVTGNVIALFSDCSKSSDKPLNLAINEVAKGFDRLETNKQKTFFYNGREAVYGEFRGHIDGIKVSMETLVFNKNKCFFQLSYSGVSNQFDKEKPFFDQFQQDFKAP